MSYAMFAIGIYNLAWAAISISGWFPAVFPDSGPAAAMTEGLMGLGLILASGEPYRHWPMVFISALWMGGWSILSVRGLETGRLGSGVWWVVATDFAALATLGVVLGSAYRATLGKRRTATREIQRLALHRKTQFGVSLEEISRLSPVLLVFLRHAGCTFCREALADLAAQRAEIEAQGTRVVLVHMSAEENAAAIFAKYGLEDVARVSDPGCAVYRAFGLPRGSLGDVLGPKVWWRGFQAAILGRHGLGALQGDGFQMPGVFLLFPGEVVRSYRHQSAADRPDYMALVSGRQYSSPELRG